jgi:hypothetical protein
MRKKFEAGVLVYTLMMAVIFSFVLQVYFKAILSTKLEIQSQEAYGQAQMMLSHVKRYRELVDGQVYTYDKGSVSLSLEQTRVFVNQTQQVYSFAPIVNQTLVSKEETDLLE